MGRYSIDGSDEDSGSELFDDRDHIRLNNADDTTDIPFLSQNQVGVSTERLDINSDTDFAYDQNQHDDLHYNFKPSRNPPIFDNYFHEEGNWRPMESGFLNNDVPYCQSDTSTGVDFYDPNIGAESVRINEDRFLGYDPKYLDIRRGAGSSIPRNNSRHTEYGNNLYPVCNSPFIDNTYNNFNYNTDQVNNNPFINSPNNTNNNNYNNIINQHHNCNNGFPNAFNLNPNQIIYPYQLPNIQHQNPSLYFNNDMNNTFTTIISPNSSNNNLNIPSNIGFYSYIATQGNVLNSDPNYYQKIYTKDSNTIINKDPCISSHCTIDPITPYPSIDTVNSVTINTYNDYKQGIRSTLNDTLNKNILKNKLGNKMSDLCRQNSNNLQNNDQNLTTDYTDSENISSIDRNVYRNDKLTNHDDQNIINENINININNYECQEQNNNNNCKSNINCDSSNINISYNPSHDNNSNNEQCLDSHKSCIDKNVTNTSNISNEDISWVNCISSFDDIVNNQELRQKVAIYLNQTISDRNTPASATTNKIYKCSLCGWDRRSHFCPNAHWDVDKLQKYFRKLYPDLFNVKRREIPRPRPKGDTLSKYKCSKCKQEKGRGHKCPAK